MITNLRIENFALIDEASIHFTDGFTVITGETGSGKSILLNALNLILGERADFSVIGEKKDKSIVEAELNLKAFDVQDFFQEHELDYFDTCIVRREISKQGRSRAFINDTPVGLNVLKAFSSSMIHIHSQYNTLELKDPNYQLNVLDILAQSTSLKSEYSTKYGQFASMKKKLNQLESDLADKQSMADYNSFQFNELSALKLEENDFESLQQELSVFENADELRSAYGQIIEGLSSDNSVGDLLAQLKSGLQKLGDKDGNLKELLDRIESARLEIQDIGDEAVNQLEKIDVDPERIEEISGLVDEYNRVLFKHKLGSQSELVEFMKGLESEVSNLDDLTNQIEALKSSLVQNHKELLQLATNLHEKRKSAIPAIQKEIKSELDALKLLNTSFTFKLDKTDELTANGISKLEMLFSPNAGVPEVPIHKAASGGELSRVMLALQSLMSSKTRLRSVFFDEIDTGVSGDVAQKVGNTLAKMGQGMQVIAITHLPQVAAKGGQHLKVSKQTVDGKTKSKVEELTEMERIEETARLMSGDKINEAALQNARELMR